jgi:uncharacterized membrane protein
MTEESYIKPWWQSKSIWGSIVSVAALVASALLGVNIDASTQAEVVNIILTITGAAGGALAVYGRVVADKAIG